MAVATLQVQAEISRILPSLPAGADVRHPRMNTNVFPVAAYSLDLRQTSTCEDQGKSRSSSSCLCCPRSRRTARRGPWRSGDGKSASTPIPHGWQVTASR